MGVSSVIIDEVFIALLTSLFYSTFCSDFAKYNRTGQIIKKNNIYSVNKGNNGK
jgi:hypothetical protein